jgi:hypothetical protein
MGFKAIIAATTVLLAATAADSAFAQVAAKRGVVASDESRWGLHTPKRSIQHNKGRWSVNVEVEEPVGREIKAKDVEAGAFFRIAPQLKVGGSVRLDDKFSRPERLKPEDREPQVRLETKFNF